MKDKKLIADVCWSLIYLTRERMSPLELVITQHLIEAGWMQWGDDGKLEACDSGVLIALRTE